jgi:hypothetical protein
VKAHRRQRGGRAPGRGSILAPARGMSPLEIALLVVAGAEFVACLWNWASLDSGPWFVAGLGELIILGQVVIAAGWRGRAMYWRGEAERLDAHLAGFRKYLRDRLPPDMP